jgi:hypothetical protein
MELLTYSYLPFPAKDLKTGKIIGEIFRPIIPVRINYKHQFCKHLWNCLADSGADRNLFPATIGELLRIKIKEGKPRIISGIGKGVIRAFTHNIKLYVGVTSFDAQIDFSYEHQVPLLGRFGFFDHFFAVTFREKKKVIELFI